MIVMILAALASASADGAPNDGPRPLPRYSQVIVQEQVTVQVRRRDPDLRGRIEWKEKKGPRCIPAAGIAGAAVIGPTSVDIILRDNRRIRAKLESSCPALDFYRGFYVKPNPDGQICADRDAIRSRMGGQCEIDTFKRLEPKVHD